MLSVKVERLLKRWKLPIVKEFYPEADVVVAISHGVADDLVKTVGLAPERIDVIYNPIVTPEAEARAQAGLDHPWFKPGEPPVVLGVGSLTPQKDFACLVDAFARVRRERPARWAAL